MYQHGHSHTRTNLDRQAILENPRRTLRLHQVELRRALAVKERRVLIAMLVPKAVEAHRPLRNCKDVTVVSIDAVLCKGERRQRTIQGQQSHGDCRSYATTQCGAVHNVRVVPWALASVPPHVSRKRWECTSPTAAAALHVHLHAISAAGISRGTITNVEGRCWERCRSAPSTRVADTALAIDATACVEKVPSVLWTGSALAQQALRRGKRTTDGAAELAFADHAVVASRVARPPAAAIGPDAALAGAEVLETSAPASHGQWHERHAVQHHDGRSF
jgi:hypothetical protein